MTRFQLTPIPEVRAWGVDQVTKSGGRTRIKTFEESKRDKALRLVYTLNRKYSK